MDKQILNDVITPKKSVRQIVFPGNRVRPSSIPNQEKIVQNKRPNRPPKNKTFRRGLWIIAIISVLILYFIFTLIFSGAEITISTRAEKVAVSGQFSASINASGASLPFEVMTISKEDSRQVKATGEEQVNKKASGEITIYNNYTKEKLRLIKNTRFESKNGLIYRIPKLVDVPGMTGTGGNETPGSITVTVYADAEGPEYNIDKAVFTVPGLKGDPRYDKVRAETKTPISGGYSGILKKVSIQDEQNSRSEMQKEIKDELAITSKEQIPQGFIMFEDGLFFTTETLENIDGTDAGSVLVREKGYLHAIIFNESALSSYLASKYIAGYNGEEVVIENLDSLNFKLASSSSKLNTNIWESNDLTFSLTGNVSIIWTFDENNLKKDLAGKTKRQINTVLADYPGIVKAEVVIRPFWEKKFPDSPNKIDFVIAQDTPK